MVFTHIKYYIPNLLKTYYFVLEDKKRTIEKTPDHDRKSIMYEAAKYLDFVIHEAGYNLNPNFWLSNYKYIYFQDKDGELKELKKPISFNPDMYKPGFGPPFTIWLFNKGKKYPKGWLWRRLMDELRIMENLKRRGEMFDLLEWQYRPMAIMPLKKKIEFKFDGEGDLEGMRFDTQEAELSEKTFSTVPQNSPKTSRISFSRIDSNSSHRPR